MSCSIISNRQMRLIKTLLEIADGKQIEYQGYIYTIYSLVRSNTDNPGVVLLQILENTDLLITGLKNLNSNIKGSLQGLYSDAKERMAAILDLNLLYQGIGLSGEDLDNVHILGTLKTNRVITIENLTTFFLWQEKDSLIIYLGGYHNSVRRRLLRMIHEQVPQAEYLHFGDIDVGGFEIYEDLCGKTGIAFQPYHMGIKELEKYQSYTRPLTEHDRKRLDFLLDKKRKDSDCVYLEVLEYMKKHGIKLEQECIQS